MSKNPSEKSIRSTSLGHESESTEGGSDLLYCLIKINFVCPMLKVKGWNEQWEIVKHPLLSHYWGSTMWGWKLAVTAPWLQNSWHVALGRKKIKRSSDVPGHAKQKDIIKGLWLFWHGMVTITPKTNNPLYCTLHARSNSLNSVSCFHLFSTVL